MVAAGQLSVHELHFTNDAGTLQRFGERDFSTQNAVFQNVWMEKLGCGCQKECWEIQGNLERRHLKSAPSDPDGQLKICGETEWARFGQMNPAAHIPLTRVDRCLKFYRNRARVLSW